MRAARALFRDGKNVQLTASELALFIVTAAPSPSVLLAMVGAEVVHAEAVHG